MSYRTTYLARADVRQKLDRPTGSHILQYVGRRLQFDEYLYGYPDGTFFYVDPADIELPEHLETLANAACGSVSAWPGAQQVRDAVAAALIAEAMVNAPGHLAELADPVVEWSNVDRMELERRHRIADANAKALIRELEHRLAQRAAALRCEGIQPPPVAEPAPVAVPAPPPVPVDVVIEEEESPPVVDEDDGEADEEALTPTSRTVRRACVAMEFAREIELPQRLPAGARRQLRQLPPGTYISHGRLLDARQDLCGAMTDARAMARKNRWSTVIQYDGEWPVVVRRYGQQGRTIYKVEAALRRFLRENRMDSEQRDFEARVQQGVAA